MSTATARSLFRRTLSTTALIALVTVPLHAQTDVTTPRAALGFDIGDDYHLANYQQFEAYWRTLAQESPRMVLEEIGQTEEGRTQLMAIITSPENHRNLERYRNISRRLALAEGVSEDEARRLAREGKAVVWIDGGLHATEVLGAHQLMDLVYQMVSRTDAETMRFLDDVILLAAHANPDGMDLVSNWYMRHDDPEERSTSNIPVLYQKYVGHDNNRDFYMITQAESENMTRIQYREWFPQIIYNHHQTGPAGTVMFAPPFRDPFNYNFDPLIPLSIESVGAAMHSRFVLEGKPGTTMRSGASYSTWWNGGLRTTPYFHNMIGLLTETIGHPTPMRIPLMLDRQLPQNDIPYPIPPQEWHFRQSIEYSLTANYAVLNYASRFREELLFNIWRMGMNAIEKGNRDTWRTDPTVIQAAAVAARAIESDGPQRGRFGGTPAEVFDQVFRAPERRDPRGYIIPSDQEDFPTAVKFVNTLIKGGVAVDRATRDFTVMGQQYPAGSFVIKTGQAFRAHVLDMFEPQHHPNDFAYPGGPPISPYDNTGWTVAFQMGVEFDRILEGFDGPFDRIEGFADVPEGQVANASGASGYLVSHAVNDAFIATNRLLAAGDEVYWLTEPLSANDRTWPAGTIYLPASSVDRATAERLARELGVDFHGVRATPANAMRMSGVRVGLWDEYGGSMPSGWARWILEQFEFPYRLVFPQELDAGNLRSSFDVLVFVDGAIGDGDGGGFGGRGPEPEDIPEEYRDRLGDVTVERTVPQLEAFLRDGGTIVTIGGSTALGRHIGLPLENYLVDHEKQPLSRDEYFVPGSIVRLRVDNTRPIAWGLPEHVDVHFNNSPVFRQPPENSAVRSVAWFDEREPLRSGWAWGQHYLMGGMTIAEAQVGRGMLYLLGPEVIRRGQPHGTFKFLFNGIYLAGAEAVEMETASGQ